MSLPGTGLAEAGGYWDGKLYLRHRARLGTRVARRGDASGRPFDGVKAKVNTETMRDDFLTASATGFFSFFLKLQIISPRFGEIHATGLLCVLATASKRVCKDQNTVRTPGGNLNCREVIP